MRSDEERRKAGAKLQQSIIPSSYITNNLPLVASLLASFASLIPCSSIAVTDRNVALNSPLYSSRVIGCRVISRPLPWGAANFTHVSSIFDTMGLSTKTNFVDLIIAVDIAYQRPGLTPHFELFLETILRIFDLSSQPNPHASSKGQGRKKKKGKPKEEEVRRGYVGSELSRQSETRGNRDSHSSCTRLTFYFFAGATDQGDYLPLWSSSPNVDIRRPPQHRLRAL